MQGFGEVVDSRASKPSLSANLWRLELVCNGSALTSRQIHDAQRSNEDSDFVHCHCTPVAAEAVHGPKETLDMKEPTREGFRSWQPPGIQVPPLQSRT